MIVLGVPLEPSRERRVATVPEVVPRLVKLGFHVLVEKGAGGRACFPDEAYAARGAEVVSRQVLLERSQVLLQVDPDAFFDDAGLQLRSGTVLLGFQAPADRPEALKALDERGVTAFAMERVPRISRAQGMDALSSMATVAGYRAVLLAAHASPRFFPMLTTAAGSVPPARVLVVGAGVAGLFAMATARRLGAVVSGYDIRPASKEQVESVGAKFVQFEIGSSDTEAAGGYAREQAEDVLRRQQEGLAAHLASHHVVITTAAVPGKPAPRLITGAMVEGMPPGSVLVDLAADRGGNCEVTRPGEQLTHGPCLVMGPLNLPSDLPIQASQMYARNLLSFLQLLVKDEQLAIPYEDEIVAASLVTEARRAVS